MLVQVDNHDKKPIMAVRIDDNIYSSCGRYYYQTEGGFTGVWELNELDWRIEVEGYKAAYEALDQMVREMFGDEPGEGDSDGDET